MLLFLWNEYLLAKFKTLSSIVGVQNLARVPNEVSNDDLGTHEAIATMASNGGLNLRGRSRPIEAE